MSTKGVAEGRRALGTNQRERELSPRQLGVNPRTLGTNPRAKLPKGMRERRFGVQKPSRRICNTCFNGEEHDCPTCHGRAKQFAVLELNRADAAACSWCEGTGWEHMGGNTVRRCPANCQPP